MHKLPVAYRPIHIDGGEEVKRGLQQLLASGAVAKGGANPPQGSVLNQAFSLAGVYSYGKGKRNRLSIKALVTTQLLRNVEYLHWLPWQTPMCAGFSA